MLSSLSISRDTLRQLFMVSALATLAIAVFHFLGIDLAHAQLISQDDAPANIQGATGGETSIKDLLNTIVNYFLFFLGFVATLMVIYAGALYVTSSGNEEQTGKAKKIILYAVVGIILILISFALVNAVIFSATGAPPA